MHSAHTFVSSRCLRRPAGPVRCAGVGSRITGAGTLRLRRFNDGATMHVRLDGRLRQVGHRAPAARDLALGERRQGRLGGHASSLDAPDGRSRCTSRDGPRLAQRPRRRRGLTLTLERRRSKATPRTVVVRISQAARRQDKYQVSWKRRRQDLANARPASATSATWTRACRRAATRRPPPWIDLTLDGETAHA